METSQITADPDLFALTDEQILEIAPGSVVDGAQPAASHLGTAESAEHQRPQADASTTGHGTTSTGHGQAAAANPSCTTSRESSEPPAWLAAEMKDPWIGDEARELWDGVVQARNEAAAYRAAIATPEDACALKDLYPGGVSEARAAAERARTLDEFDRAFFGSTGGTPGQISAARARLAQQLVQQDPAAFREMVQLGLQALEGFNVATPFRTASPRLNTEIAPSAESRQPQNAGLKPGATQSQPSSDSQVVASYSAFERAANEELERSVGSAITRTIDQALPNLAKRDDRASAGAGQPVPLSNRLAASVRADVESALKADRQLGEQIAQILAARRFDDATRTQVVRLIGDRAQQLVPSAARRVISEWTQATLAAHRSDGERSDAARSRREVPPAAGEASSLRRTDRNSSNSRLATETRRQDASATPVHRRGIDYRKLSDEQILDL
jgi:hypothetical protein